MGKLFVSLLALLWMAEAAFAGQLVVIDSSAPGLTPGAILDDSKPIELAAGTTVTLVSESGKVTNLKGPFSGLPGPAGKSAGGGSGGGSLTASLAKLVGGQSATSKLGVMRSNKAQVPSDPWALNVERTGNHCARSGSAPELWRSKAVKAITLTLKLLPKGARSSTGWPAGAERIGWPGEVALKDGGKYMARMSGKTSAARLVIHLVPADLPTDAHRAVWMAGKGCIGQARALLAGLRNKMAK